MRASRHDLAAVMHGAWVAGVRRMVVTGTSVASSQAALQLHTTHPTRLFATAGVHPHHASELGAGGIEALEELLAHPGVVAIGECGLDYYRNFSPREAQLSAFRAQLELASTTAQAGVPAPARCPRGFHRDTARVSRRD